MRERHMDRQSFVFARGVVRVLVLWLPKRSSLVLIVLLSVTLAACTMSRPPAARPTAALPITPIPTASPAATPSIEPSATPTSLPTPSLIPVTLSPAQVFDVVSPAVAFIETPAGTGSGVLIEDGYVVTNYHVVWPYEEARVVFPDGSDYPDAPVLAWDPLADLALIGPLETAISPLGLADGEDLVIGSEVFFVGYPSESDEYPQPTIARGILSRVRQWESGEVTYFQSDAAIAGGQSGGVLVSGLGEVVGITGFSFGEGNFGLAASVMDILPRLERLMVRDDVAGIGSRRLPVSGGEQNHPYVTLKHRWDHQIYVIREPVGTQIEISADGGEADIALVVYDVSGDTPVYADDGAPGPEALTLVTEWDVPYFVGLFQYSPSSMTVSVEASHDLIPYLDLDDNRGVAKGQTIYGYLDHPGDTDYFALPLRKGETVNVLVDSILINPYLMIAQPGDPEEAWVFDYNSGGGLFGTNPELTFAAPERGIYLIIVQDVGEYSCCGYYPQQGGYSLQVREPYAGAPTPVAPKPTVTPTQTDSGS